MKHNKRLKIILLIATALLLIPFIAMQFTEEVQWTLFDFIVAAALLIGTGLIVEFVLQNVKKSSYRIAACIAILAVLLLGWVELSVGLLGTPFAGS